MKNEHKASIEKREKLKQLHKERSLVLEKTRTYLKRKFSGIDETVDKICDQLIPWFVYETPRQAPLVINIWGITGTGKTELVQDLCIKLSLKSHCYDAQAFMNAHKGVGAELVGDDDIKSAIIIDELHRIKTKVESDSKPSNDERYRLWEMLSGCLKFTHNTKNIEKSFIMSNLENPQETSKEKLISRFMSDLRWASPLSAQAIWPKAMALIERHGEADSNLFDSMLNLIRSMPTTEYISVKKSVIFVLGNLDGAYRNVVEDLETLEADDLSEKMSRITSQECKEALLQLFSAEQVSRLGSNHFVMPTLTKKSYEKVIADKIASFCKEYYDTYGVYFLIDSSVNEMIYDQIVIPSQGMRNVLSGFNYLLDSPISCMLPTLLKSNEEDPVQVSYSDEKYVFAVGNVVFQKKVDLLKKNNLDSPEFAELIVTHESGHALVYYLLNDNSPLKVVISTNSTRMGGYIKKAEKEIQTKTDLMNDVKIAFGGYYAEKIIFGEDKISTGSYSDLKKAGSIVSKMVNEYGLGSKISPMRAGSPFEAPFLRTNEKDKDKEIAKIYEELAKETENLLTENKDQLEKLIAFLKERRTTYQEEMNEFMDSINGNAEIDDLFGSLS